MYYTFSHIFSERKNRIVNHKRSSVKRVGETFFSDGYNILGFPCMCCSLISFHLIYLSPDTEGVVSCHV
jgi:hypothetical protein